MQYFILNPISMCIHAKETNCGIHIYATIGIKLMLISPRSEWEKYVCPECNKIIDDPVQLSCGHHMCCKCFNNMKSKSQ